MGLKINDKKTQLLTISSSRNQNDAWLTLRDGSAMHSAEKLKLLGFVFNKNPTIHAQIDNLISKAASRIFVLRHLASETANKTKLKNVYCSIERSVLEYSSVTYGPMLAQYQKNRLESIQKKCLKSIYGFKKTYDCLLYTSPSPRDRQKSRMPSSA